MKKLIIFTLAVLAMSSCKDGNEPMDGGSGKIGGIHEKVDLDPNIVYYSNGVYYFSSVGKDFGESLSNFLQDSSKQVLAIAGDGTHGYGKDIGYWVIVKNK